MKIILGIGNPGARYKGTRHNMGFRVVDRLAALAGTALKRRRFNARIETVTWGDQTVLLIKPQCYVNLSGQVARAACDYYDVPPASLLVVLDDVNLPLAKIRFRAQGSAGGHNGLKSLIEVLGTDAFCRLRIGVENRQHAEQDLVDYVLDRFLPAERELIDAAIEQAAEGCHQWVAEDIGSCMNRFN